MDTVSFKPIIEFELNVRFVRVFQDRQVSAALRALQLRTIIIFKFLLPDGEGYTRGSHN